MGNPTDKSIRIQLIFGSVLLMLVALFTSRMLLTIGMGAFMVFTTVHQNFLQQVRNFFSSPLLVGMTLLFFIPLLSGFWSNDEAQWVRSVRIKLPMLLLPFAFAGNWQLSRKQWRQIAFVFIILIAAGCTWSMYQYLDNMQQINKSYLSAKAIPTPLENDHIRFSLLVTVAIMASVLLFMKERSGAIKFLLAAAILFFIIYLHVLSVRTGLAGLYIFLIIGLTALLARTKKKKIIIGLSVVLIVTPLAAWLLLPTFQNRIRYMIYDLQHIRAQTYLPGSNDGSRLMSIKAGWNLLKDNPLGVGSGDVVNETLNWYEKHVPAMVDTGLYPSSEWLMYGGTAGWPGIVLFTMIMLLPFLEKTSERIFWISLNIIIAFSLLFDIGLEVQFGVFIYAFVVLWWWKWLKKEYKEIATANTLQNQHSIVS